MAGEGRLDPRGPNKFVPGEHPVPGNDSPYAGDHDRQDRERREEQRDPKER
jgi:hypothetical protein